MSEQSAYRITVTEPVYDYAEYRWVPGPVRTYDYATEAEMMTALHTEQGLSPRDTRGHSRFELQGWVWVWGPVEQSEAQDAPEIAHNADGEPMTEATLRGEPIMQNDDITYRRRRSPGSVTYVWYSWVGDQEFGPFHTKAVAREVAEKALAGLTPIECTQREGTEAPAVERVKLTAAEKKHILAAIRIQEQHQRTYADLVGVASRAVSVKVRHGMASKGLLAEHDGLWRELTDVAYEAVGRDDLAAQWRAYEAFWARHGDVARTPGAFARGVVADWDEALELAAFDQNRAWVVRHNLVSAHPERVKAAVEKAHAEALVAHVASMKAGDVVSGVVCGTIHGKPITRRVTLTLDRAPWFAGDDLSRVVVTEGNGGTVVRADSLRIEPQAYSVVRIDPDGQEVVLAGRKEGCTYEYAQQTAQAMRNTSYGDGKRYEVRPFSPRPEPAPEPSPYAQVVRVHTDGRRVIIHPRLKWDDACRGAARFNAASTPGDDFRFEVEPEGTEAPGGLQGRIQEELAWAVARNAETRARRAELLASLAEAQRRQLATGA